MKQFSELFNAALQTEGYKEEMISEPTKTPGERIDDIIGRLEYNLPASETDASGFEKDVAAAIDHIEDLRLKTAQLEHGLNAATKERDNFLSQLNAQVRESEEWEQSYLTLKCENGKLEKERDQWKAQALANQKDKERLDWLENNSGHFSEPLTLDWTTDMPTLRTAIDQAMQPDSAK